MNPIHLENIFFCHPEWSQRQQIFTEHLLCSRPGVGTSGNWEESQVIHVFFRENSCQRTVANLDCFLPSRRGNGSVSGRTRPSLQSRLFLSVHAMAAAASCSGLTSCKGGSAGLHRLRGGLKCFSGHFAPCILSLLDRLIGWGRLG